jgi:glycosyltransferase involved in cell wall biosynthesis
VIDDRDWQIPSFTFAEFFPRQTKYCIVIPVINEGERIRRQLESMREIAKLADILIADGGSTDGSLAQHGLRALGVRTLLTKTGPGKLSAQLRMAYAYALRAEYEGIVTIDGNNKDGVEAIPSFLAEIDAGFDLVQGSRFVAGGEAVNTPTLRWWSIKLMHAPVISWGAGFHYTDTTNGFRGYSRKLLLDPRVGPFRDIFETYELLAYLSVRAPQLGYRVKEIPVARRYPAHGKTPTKIGMIRGNSKLLRILFSAAMGRYNPQTSSRV